MELAQSLIMLSSDPQQRRLGILATAAALVSVYALYKQWINTRELQGDCPSVPYHNPFVGSTLEYRKNPQAFVEKWHKALGPVFRAHIFGRVSYYCRC
ncbi:hypothetical protein BDB00DRAFT_252712 [Zychaea mexicana]|uniref:uncharacterized protein n=1 Tax=Zychaea mexicana TaxID=64656 RepID=UPI0022FE36AA|nr:uncharacterized protein BDB00DRAFT_252712 [Zychaea mexicana]KAI9470410.1 hypothetical protein BDB00DRAFT_252712 [Zychaea mexicana]